MSFWLWRGLVELGDAGGFGAAAAAELSAHALDAEGDADVDGADHDFLGDAVEGLHGGAALSVGVEGADGFGEAGEADDVVGADAGEFGDAADAAHADVFDVFGGDLGVAAEQFLEDLDADVVEAGGGECAAAAAREGGADAVDDHYVLEFHWGFPSVRRGAPFGASWRRV